MTIAAVSGNVVRSIHTPRKRRVMVADDHALMVEGLVSLLGAEYEVVGVAPNGADLVAAAQNLRPELIVLDISMPGINGIDAARQLRSMLPDVRLIFVTQQLDRHYVRAAFRAGAMGYVAKHAAATELMTAMRRAVQGQGFLSPLLQEAVGFVSLAELRAGAHKRARDLTPRQREVLQHVAEGKTVREIAETLNISPKTVEFHKQALMNDTGLRTTAELTRYAVACGVIAG